jgi:MoxR-like ATPase
MPGKTDIKVIHEQIIKESAFVDLLFRETEKVIVGQERLLNCLLIGLMTRGHILLEGMPGLAKTLAIRTLARAVDTRFSRIQFTPDLLPADVIGTLIYNPAKSEFTVRKGPVFSNFILADEINRAPAKVQSALLEAMQERQVSIGTETYSLEEPFLVLATQNPLEQEGTYPLPEAQLDRFLLKVKIGYPTPAEETLIIRRNLSGEHPFVQPILTANVLARAREVMHGIYMDEKIEQYIVNLVAATRQPGNAGLAPLSPWIRYGASPRGSIGLAQAARAQAFLSHRGYVIPEDVRSICKDVLGHRIGLTYEAEAEHITTDVILDRIMNTVEVP